MSIVASLEQVGAPSWVIDLDSFRRWARSGAMPERGQFAWLAGELWEDWSLEQFFSRNQVKFRYTLVLGGLVDAAKSGYFCPDNMLLSHPGADLSTEPDAMFASWETMRSGGLRLIPGAKSGYVELEGTPDMVPEILSDSSVRKDDVALRDLYWRAGVTEYWLVDVRGQSLRFQILRYTPEAYVAVEAVDGWLTSDVFGRSFRLTRETDPLGHPQYVLAVKQSGQAASGQIA